MRRSSLHVLLLRTKRRILTVLPVVPQVLVSAVAYVSSRLPSIFVLARRFLRVLAPLTYLLTAFGVLLASLAFIVELDGRFLQRKFQAWTIIQNYEALVLDRHRQAGNKLSEHRSTIALSGDLRDALEFLNGKFDGLLCDVPTSPWVPVQKIFLTLTGDPNRSCIIPKKQRVVLSGLQAAGAFLPRIDLEGSELLEADFSGSNLSLSKFGNSDLSLARFV